MDDDEQTKTCDGDCCNYDRWRDLELEKDCCDYDRWGNLEMETN